jgi:hypothetical protein
LIGENIVGDGDGALADDVAYIKAHLIKIKKMLDDKVPIANNIVNLMRLLCETLRKWPVICPKPIFYDQIVAICKILFPSIVIG